MTARPDVIAVELGLPTFAAGHPLGKSFLEAPKAVEHFHNAMGESQKETIEHVRTMRKVLSPDRAVNFDRRVGEALANHTPRAQLTHHSLQILPVAQQGKTTRSPY